MSKDIVERLKRRADCAPCCADGSICYEWDGGELLTEAASLILEAREALTFAEQQLDELINWHYGGDIPCTAEEAAGFEKIELVLAKLNGGSNG